jgi:DNA-binding IclR family transcriptional regulator
LRELVRETRETAVYHVRQGDTRLVLYRVESPQPVRDHVQVGDLMPLGRGAGGRVISAYSGTKGAPLRPDPQGWLRRARGRSLAGSRRHRRAGLRGDGGSRGAVTLTMPANRFRKGYASAVKAAAREITSKLGGTP